MNERAAQPPLPPASAPDSPTQLRFLTCGSVDDGKSTLLGRLMFDAGLVPEDQWAAVERLSTQRGGAGSPPDFSLLFDGLLDERAQGITIDVAWRYFQTPRRRFIVADTPGHEQYTRNMVTGASQCEAALLLVDAQRGVTVQTRRHAGIVNLMGIGHLVVAVNKMDLVGWSEEVFLRLERDFLAFTRALGAREPVFVPVCAMHGDNVVHASANMPWYGGPRLLDHLESIEPAAGLAGKPADDTSAVVTDRLEANVIWMGESALFPGRRYELRTATATVLASVKRLIHRLNLDTLASEPATRLETNDIGRCEVMTERPIACDTYAVSAQTGSFILVDRLTNATLAAGMVTDNQPRKVFWEKVLVDKAARAAAKGQRPRVVWFTGLSGAGKSTLANAVEVELHRDGFHTTLIDGDNVRHGLSRDLGFGTEDRIENTRRVGEVAKLMVDAGLIVLVSLISPFRMERRMVRELLAPGEFVEVYLATPLEVCEGRDRKGLYRLAREGKLPNFTGISSPYEPPEHAEVVVDTSTEPLEAAVRRVVAALRDSES